MRHDKDLIFQLRRSGKSYKEIQKETGVSCATLSEWFKNEDWSKQISKDNSVLQIELSKERVVRMNMVRKLKLQYHYALVEKEAEEEYQIFKNEPLFWAGLMLYAGEGDKRSKSLVRISNSEFYPHRIFKLFAFKYMAILENGLKYSLIIYPDNDENTCKTRWSEEISANPNHFHKTQVIKGKEPLKRLQFGVCNTIICSTSLKKKLIKWLSLAEFENFNAVII